MKKVLAFLFLPIRLLFLLLKVFVFLLSKGNHLYLKVPAKFSDSSKSFLLRKIQGEEEPPFLTEFLIILHLIQKDPRVKHLSIEIPKLEMGFSEVASITTEIEKIKDKGISVRGFSDEGDLKSLYMLSFCQERFSSETSEFISILPSAESMFFGEVAKKWKVKIDVFQSGPYKSFGEIFTRKEFSKEARSNLTDLIEDTKSIITSPICNCSDLNEKTLQQPILNAVLLKELNFFHGLLTRESFRENYLQESIPNFLEKLETFQKESSEIQDESLLAKEKIKFLKKEKPFSKPLSENNIISRESIKNFRIFGNSDPTIAILPMKGQIVSGKPEEKEPKSGIIEGYSIRETIQEIKDDNRIKAVLLEIDSPGGSAVESEKIFQAIKDLDKTKPVYAYMSNTCASGGYYIACAARKIFSSPIGVVGSIGTIMMRFDLEGLYTKFGIFKDRIGFYPGREIFSDSGKLTKESQTFLKKEIARVENLFLKRVDEARDVGEDVLKKMSGGKIFSPLPFQESGLSDRISSLMEAIQELKSELGSKRVNLYYQAPRYNMKLAMKESLPFLGTNTQSWMISNQNPILRTILELQKLSDRTNGEIQHLNLGALFFRSMW